MSKKTRDSLRSRRDLLAGAGLAGLAGLVSGPARSADSAAAGQASLGAERSGVSASKKGVYATVPLRQEAINVAAIQSRVKAVDIRNLGASMKANLAHVLALIDQSQGAAEEWGGERVWGAHQDLLCLHEFPIQGFQPWTRTELNRVAIDLPGPESEAIGARAKKYGCYIAFGCYARDKDWPRHVINMSVIVGPDGKIVSKQWKARNILGAWGDVALIGTTIYDVLEPYVEMYGWDATLPIARTDIGNIAMTAVVGEPLLYAALAIKGAEILVMSVTGGSNADYATATARSQRFYAVGVCNAVTFDNIGFPEASGVTEGGSVIVDPRGSVLVRSANHHEDFITARVPIGDFRRTRKAPEFPMALFLPVFQQYEPVFGPNAFANYLPETYKEAGDYVRKRLSGK